MSSAVRLVKLGNVWDKRVIGIGIGEQGADRKKDLGDGEGGRPLVFQNVQTDTTVGIDVAMVDTCGEMNLWWFEGIVRWEVNIEKKDSTRVGRVFGPHDGCLPVKHVITNGSCRAVGRWIFTKID